MNEGLEKKEYWWSEKISEMYGCMFEDGDFEKLVALIMEIEEKASQASREEALGEIEKLRDALALEQAKRDKGKRHGEGIQERTGVHRKGEEGGL